MLKNSTRQATSHNRLSMLQQASVLAVMLDIVHAWLLSSIGEGAVRGF